MEKTINLEKILISKLKEYSTEDFDLQVMSKLQFVACYYAMEEAVKQTLKLASENAKIIEKNTLYDRSYITNHYISKKSILDTIKQVK